MQPTNELELRGMAVPRVLWIVMLVSVLLLIFVGGMLFFRPDAAKIHWAWQLTPFNTRFLGAIYLSAIAPLLFCLLRPQSAPLRIVLPMFAVFTTYLLLVSLAYTSYFNLSRTAPKVWFLLYGMDSFVGLYYLWRKFKQVLSLNTERSPKWSGIYRFQALLLGGYGMGLLLLAPLFSKWWAWSLDSFHSSLYSGLFLTSALGLWLLSYSLIWQEHLILNLTQAILGGLMAIGLWVVDKEIHKLNWNSQSPWIWSGLFSLFAAVGLFLALQTWISSRGRSYA